MMWIGRTLFDEQQRHLAGLDTLMDELERLRINEPRANELTSAWVAGSISDLSLISHCLHQIKLYQPWAATFETEMANVKEGLEKEYKRTCEPFQAYIQIPVNRLLASKGNPAGGRFRYPADKRRTEEHTEAMRRAEENLDEFWQAFDRDFQQAHTKSPRIQALLAERVRRRTPKWVEPVKSASTTPDRQDQDDLVKPLSDLYFNLEQRTERTVDRKTPAHPSPKAKTHGPATQQTSAGSQPPPERERYEPPLFYVDKRALKVFRILFYAPSVSSEPGEIPWNDFLHALSTIGFRAEKMYGSVWQFTPTRLVVSRSIQFHEPHPSGKIPYLIARQHGRRINKAYGWNSDMFKLSI